MKPFEFLMEYYGKRLGVQKTGDLHSDALKIMNGPHNKGEKYNVKKQQNVKYANKIMTGRIVIRPSGVFLSSSIGIEDFTYGSLINGTENWSFNGEPTMFIQVSKKSFDVRNLFITYDERHVVVCHPNLSKTEDWSEKA